MAGSNNVEADHRRGPPAPPGRASDAELAGMVQLATKDSLLEALLDWIDGLVVVLNRHRQIVLASDRVAQTLHVDSTDELIGKRLGEALGCVHVDMAAGGCGTSEKCRYCGALKAILDAPRFDAPIETECRLTLRGKPYAETVKLRVKTSLTSRSPDPFTVVVLQGVDQLERAATVAAHTSLDEDWPVGIESYEWVRKLGVGGMGSVFLVHDAEKRQYALKTVKGILLGDESVTSRFLKEIRLSIVLDHPNIVRTLRANQSDAGTVYMVTEYCPNGSAGQWLQRHGPIAP
ncbi:MAG: protein kinase, partial [Coriobacteriia bacterium]|nr:protein kinase [Coriobacteriia bacterium]